MTGQLFRAEQHTTSTYQQVSQLHIATAFETVDITGSQTATTVSVERASSWSLRKPHTAIAQTGGTLAVTSDCPATPGPECRGTIKMVVPANLTLEVSTGDGDLRVDNLSGSIALRTDDAAVTADRLHSPTVTTETVDGDIHLIFSRPPDTITATSQDGDVHIELPDTDQAYRVDAETGDGTRTVTVPTNPAANRQITANTTDGTIQINPR
jgi:hypothetical protein